MKSQLSAGSLLSPSGLRCPLLQVSIIFLKGRFFSPLYDSFFFKLHIYVFILLNYC